MYPNKGVYDPSSIRDPKLSIFDIGNAILQKLLHSMHLVSIP